MFPLFLVTWSAFIISVASSAFVCSDPELTPRESMLFKKWKL